MQRTPALLLPVQEQSGNLWPPLCRLLSDSMRRPIFRLVVVVVVVVVQVCPVQFPALRLRFMGIACRLYGWMHACMHVYICMIVSCGRWDFALAHYRELLCQCKPGALLAVLQIMINYYLYCYHILIQLKL